MLYITQTLYSWPYIVLSWDLASHDRQQVLVKANGYAKGKEKEKNISKDSKSASHFLTIIVQLILELYTKARQSHINTNWIK